MKEEENDKEKTRQLRHAGAPITLNTSKNIIPTSPNTAGKSLIHGGQEDTDKFRGKGELGGNITTNPPLFRSLLVGCKKIKP